MASSNIKMLKKTGNNKNSDECSKKREQDLQDLRFIKDLLYSEGYNEYRIVSNLISRYQNNMK